MSDPDFGLLSTYIQNAPTGDSSVLIKNFGGSVTYKTTHGTPVLESGPAIVAGVYISRTLLPEDYQYFYVDLVAGEKYEFRTGFSSADANNIHYFPYLSIGVTGGYYENYSGNFPYSEVPSVVFVAPYSGNYSIHFTNLNTDSTVVGWVAVYEYDFLAQIDHSLTDVVVTKGSALSYTIPDGSFSDLEGDAIEYGAVLVSNGQDVSLPTWLSFDPSTRTFTGTVPDDFSAITLEVFAYSYDDLFGRWISADSESDTFTLSTPAAAISSYSLDSSATNVDEGGSVTLTLTASNVAAGTWVPYTIKGTGITAGDFTDPLTGVFTVDANGQATVTLNTAVDITTEGAQTFTLALDNTPSVTTSAIINDTSTDPTYTLASSSTNVDEGNSVTLTLTTTKVATGTLLPYTLSGTGITTGDFSRLTSSSFTVGADGRATVTLKATEDQTTEGAETFSLALNDHPLVATSVLINDTSKDVTKDSLFLAQQILPTGKYPDDVEISDINGDSKSDLVVTYSYDHTVSVLLGNGNGSFQTQQSFPAYITGDFAIGDFNGDGKRDLVVISGYAVSVLPGNGNGSFQTQQTSQAGADPRSITISDFNGDGKSDLAVATGSTYDGAVSVLLGNGNGSFQTPQSFPTGSFPIDVATGDFNGDGKNDIAVANGDDDNVSVLLGNGDGSFQAQQLFLTGDGPEGIAIGDFNEDGKSDLGVINSYDNNVSVLLGKGDGSFQAQQTFRTGDSPQAVAIGDFNGDSKSDIAVTNGDDDTLSVLLGNGDGSFKAQQFFPTGYYPNAIAMGDVNGDGGIDLAVINWFSGTVSVLLNNPPPANNAPAGANKTISLNEDGSRVLTIADFGFSDPNDSPANSLLAVKIATLPDTGTLKLNGVAVTAGQSVLAIDLAAGKLAFTPAANANGTNYAHFTFQVQDNGGTLNGGVDLDPTPNTIQFNVAAVRDDLNLIGTAGNDTLSGDKIDPGSYDTLSGIAGNDILNGLAGNDTLLGGAGDDTLDGGTGADNMDGGTDNDRYTIDNAGDTVIEAADAGIDTVTNSLVNYTLTAHVENLTLTGTGNLNGTGNDLNNILTGNAANNTLNGAGGIDTLIGGQGNDTYIVDSNTDIITEKPSGNTDTVQSSVSYTLGSNLENLTLTRMSAINGTGNTLNNALTGNAGNNTLDGKAGSDWASYANASAGVTVSLDLTAQQNTVGAGKDTLINIENLIGSLFNDTLVGNTGNNALNGGLGKDTLTGGGGADSFVYTALAETGRGSTNCDLITDFSTAQGDKIDVKAIDANTVLAGTQAWSFVEAFTGVAGQISVDTVNHLVLFDQNGDKATDFVIKLAGGSSLTTADFIFT